MTGPAFEFGEFRLEPELRRLSRDGQPVALTPKAFDTLVALVEWRDRVAGKTELLQRLWPEHVVEENNLTQQIFTLRKALGDGPEGARFIATVPRYGYRFVADVRVVEAGVLEGPPAVEAAAPLAGRWRRLVLWGALLAVLAAGAGYWLGRRGAAAPRRVMLAVLPFENLDGSSEDEYVADGLTEEILTVLGRLNPERLGVIARTSVMAYKGQRKGVGEISRELSVGYVLEGTVRRAGGRLRVTAQLIEVAGQTHVWAEAYERELSDLVQVEEGIARSIGQRLSIELLPRSAAPLGAPGVAAHTAYLKGLYFWNKRDAAHLTRAVELFDEAIALEPSYARAHAGRAAASAALASSADALPVAEARAQAEASARRGLELEPELPEGHAALAVVRCRFDWNWPECERELRLALAADPNYATGHHWLGELLVERGRFAQGQAELREAHALDPLSPPIHANLGVAYMYARDDDQALASFAQALEIDPSFLLAHRARGLTLLRMGRTEEALASLRRAREIDPRSAHAGADLGYALARSGRANEARAILQELERMSHERPVSAYDFAVVQAGLGENQAALAQLEQAYADRATGVRWLKVEPIFDPLRGEPRFQELLRRVGLPD